MRPPIEVNPLIKDSESTQITEQAAAWFLRMQQGNGNADEQAAFQAWLGQNEAHRMEYQKYLQLWQRLDHLDYRPASSTRESANLNIIWVLFLSVLTTVLVWAINYEEVIQTAIGERQQMVFNDGTVIELNTDTELHVTPSVGRVNLRYGAAKCCSKSANIRYAHSRSILAMVSCKTSAQNSMLPKMAIKSR